MLQNEKEYLIEKINKLIASNSGEFSEENIKVLLEIREKVKIAQTAKEFYDALLGFIEVFKE